jgi:hypothetical protein
MEFLCKRCAENFEKAGSWKIQQFHAFGKIFMGNIFFNFCLAENVLQTAIFHCCLFANCGSWQSANWMKLPQILDFQDEIHIQAIGIILAKGQAGQFNLWQNLYKFPLRMNWRPPSKFWSSSANA